MCPWCFIGTRRLEHVLAARGITAEVTYRTFLLDPNTPDEGKNVPEMIRTKYGRDPAPWLYTIATNVCRDLWRPGAHRLSRRAASVHDEAVADRLTCGGSEPEQNLSVRAREALVR